MALLHQHTMGPRLSTTLASISPRLKCRLRATKADFLSPPTSTPTLERPLRKRKIDETEDVDPDLEDLEEECERNLELAGCEEDFQQESDEDDDCDPLRPPQFWDKLPIIPLVTAALLELDRRNRKARRHARYYPAPVTHELRYCDLQRYARHGGPDFSDLRAGGEMPSSRGRGAQGHGRQGRGGKGPVIGGRVRKTPSKATASQPKGMEIKETNKGTKSGPYDAAFKQHLIYNQVWPIGHWLESGELPPPPNNLEAILAYINGGRASLEPDVFTQNDFTAFLKSYNQATSEEARSRTLELVEGMLLSLSSAHIKRGPVKFSNLRPLTSDNLVPGNPDRVYGSRPEKLHRSITLSELESLILPTAAKDLACPNFIVHIKGPAGTPETASIQAVYDGALAARSMEALWLFGKDDGQLRDGDGDGAGDQTSSYLARTLTCTFAAGALRIYAVYVRPRTDTPTLDSSMDSSLDHPPDSSLHNVQYITTPLGAWFLDSNLEEFRRGVTVYRNAIEWARIQREKVIEQANRAAKTKRAATKGPIPVLVSDGPESSGSVDQLS